MKIYEITLGINSLWLLEHDPIEYSPEYDWDSICEMPEFLTMRCYDDVMVMVIVITDNIEKIIEKMNGYVPESCEINNRLLREL